MRSTTSNNVKKKIYIQNDASIETELIDLIYEMVIQTVSNRTSPKTDLNWRSYNSSVTG